jgi:uncharacterized protein
MKLLCVSDEIDPLVYSNGIKERFSDIDIVLAAGDLPLSYYGFIVSSLNKPLVFVFGNHKLSKIHLYKHRYRDMYPRADFHSDSREDSTGALYAGGKIIRLRGMLIAGLGGSIRYNNGINQYTNFGMRLYMLRLLPGLVWNRIVHGRYLDILLTHAPPEGIHDQFDLCHRGFRPFITFIKRFRPRYLIHGHIHLYDNNATRTTRFLNTLVVNAFKHTVVDFEVPK